MKLKSPKIFEKDSIHFEPIESERYNCQTVKYNTLQKPLKLEKTFI